MHIVVKVDFIINLRLVGASNDEVIVNISLEQFVTAAKRSFEFPSINGNRRSLETSTTHSHHPNHDRVCPSFPQDDTSSCAVCVSVSKRYKYPSRRSILFTNIHKTPLGSSFIDNFLLQFKDQTPITNQILKLLQWQTASPTSPFTLK